MVAKMHKWHCNMVEKCIYGFVTSLCWNNY